jgi:ribosomal protein L21E
MPTFKPGDLVKIKDGTHQDGMPDHRVGMIIEHGEASGNYTEAYTVVFLGTDIQLKFHEMFLERFTSS